MTAVMILNLLHVLTAFLLVSGIVGRGLALRDAARANEIHTVAALVRLGGRFETLVRAPSIALLGWASWRPGAAGGRSWGSSRAGARTGSSSRSFSTSRSCP